MSESLEFEDLELLAGDDLRAVFNQMEPEEVVAALWGTPAGLRDRLLRRLPRRTSVEIERNMAATESVSFDSVRTAQQRAIQIMCQLSRNGQIAFDVPEDLVA